MEAINLNRTVKILHKISIDDWWQLISTRVHLIYQYEMATLMRNKLFVSVNFT